MRPVNFNQSTKNSFLKIMRANLSTIYGKSKWSRAKAPECPILGHSGAFENCKGCVIPDYIACDVSFVVRFVSVR